MADNKNSVDTMQLAVRAIVMFFGLSMVVLGSYDIKARHGSVANYLKKGSEPLVNKVGEKLPKVKWEKMSKLFKMERAQETWEIKTEKLAPNGQKKNSAS